VTAVALATYPGTNGRIAFRRYFNDSHTKSAIFTIKSDGSGEVQVTHVLPHAFDDQPDWSPEGRRLAFTRCVVDGPCAVYLVRADGSGVKRLTPPCASGPPKCADDANISFLPDGKHVVFTRSTGTVRHSPSWDQIQHSDLVVSDLNGRHVRKIIGSKPFTADYDFAAFSPDGKRFVYERANAPWVTGGAGHSALFVANANGSGERRISPWSLDAGDNPDWSPDGNWIVFRTHVRSDRGCQIELIHPDGSGLQQLTHFKTSANVRSAAFSPDSKQVVLATDNNQGGNPDVYVMNLDGSDLHKITTSTLWDSAADWGTAQ
jgi:Tol biopolymer transport system component